MLHKNQKMAQCPAYGYVDNLLASYPHIQQQLPKFFTHGFVNDNSTVWPWGRKTLLLRT
jgi:hypothetical protein